MIDSIPMPDGAHTLVALSDIHSNSWALEACLHYAQETLEADGYLLLGDFLTDYKEPLRTLDMIYELQSQAPVFTVRGNREDYLLRDYHPTRILPSQLSHPSSQTGSLAYTAKHLREQDWQFIESLPLSRTLAFGDAPPLTICHGTLRNNRELAYPVGDTLDVLFDSMSTDLLLHGHTHVRSEIVRDAQTVVDVGLIAYSSMPTSYTDAQIEAYLEAPTPGTKSVYASLVELTWQPGDTRYTIHYHDVPYDPYPIIAGYKDTELYTYAPWWCEMTFYELLSGRDYMFAMVMEAGRRARDEGHSPHFIPERYFKEAFTSIRMRTHIPPKHPAGFERYLK